MKMKGHANERARTKSAARMARDMACAAAVGLALVCAMPVAGFAQSGGGLPRTTIAPDDGASPGMPPGAPAANERPGAEEGGEETASPAPAATPIHHRHRAAVRHHAIHSEPVEHTAVEPAKAMLKLKQDAWAYSRPSKSSNTVERVHVGKFIDVTGTTRYYLQVRLKSGATAFVPIAAVDMTRPTDKIFKLSSDAPVVSEPSRYGHKLSEVHRGHDVHVVASSLNYLKIKMKDGLEGFIPMSAVE
jgi:hypothetical protein